MGGEREGGGEIETVRGGLEVELGFKVAVPKAPALVPDTEGVGTSGVEDTVGVTQGEEVGEGEGVG